MNHAILIHDHERLFVRSCLETAPDGHRAARPSLGGSGSRRGPMGLHVLKQKLLPATLEHNADPRIHKQLCGAANAAAELVWNTAHPALLYPCLFEELAQTILDRASLEQWDAAPYFALNAESNETANTFEELP
jgi:hypothetical protein